jgi:hypothetical protein
MKSENLFKLNAAVVMDVILHKAYPATRLGPQTATSLIRRFGRT